MDRRTTKLPLCCKGIEHHLSHVDFNFSFWTCPQPQADVFTFIIKIRDVWRYYHHESLSSKRNRAGVPVLATNASRFLDIVLNHYGTWDEVEVDRKEVSTYSNAVEDLRKILRSQGVRRCCIGKFLSSFDRVCVDNNIKCRKEDWNGPMDGNYIEAYIYCPRKKWSNSKRSGLLVSEEILARGITPYDMEDGIKLGQVLEKSKEEDCAICLKGFADGEKFQMMEECKHLYHKDCILPWFRRSSTCPLCRSEIDPEESTSYYYLEWHSCK